MAIAGADSHAADGRELTATRAGACASSCLDAAFQHGVVTRYSLSGAGDGRKPHQRVHPLEDAQQFTDDLHRRVMTLMWASS